MKTPTCTFSYGARHTKMYTWDFSFIPQGNDGRHAKMCNVVSRIKNVRNTCKRLYYSQNCWRDFLM